MDCSLGQLVISKQGRDNGKVYVVIKTEGSYCYCADGRKTTGVKPKKKNTKHLQVTHWISEELVQKLQDGILPQDIEIREFINNHRPDCRAQEVPDVETRRN